MISTNKIEIALIYRQQTFYWILHKQNWAASTDLNFIVTYWILLKHQALLTIQGKLKLAIIIFILPFGRGKLWRNPRKRVARWGETLKY